MATRLSPSGKADGAAVLPHPQMQCSDLPAGRVGATARPAFSLIELLTVVAIVAILCAIIIPVTQNIRKRSERTQCSSNLRQIGAAMRLYGIDNSGDLPGPAFLAVSRRTVVSRDVIRHIRDYVPLATNGEEVCILSICPTADAHYNRNANAPHYRRISQLPDTAGGTFDPFGYATSDKPENLDTLARRTSLAAADIPLIYDHDAQTRGPADGPSAPVHDGYRNYLFLDGRVETLPGANPFAAKGIVLE